VPQRRERRVERVVLERQVGRVTLAPVDVDAGDRRVLACPVEHRGGDVDADHVRAAPGRRDRDAAGATADVEHRVAALHPRPLDHVSGEREVVRCDLFVRSVRPRVCNLWILHLYPVDTPGSSL
jgi:hypothetical protein